MVAYLCMCLQFHKDILKRVQPQASGKLDDTSIRPLIATSALQMPVV